MRQPPPLASETPLPTETARAAHFVASHEPHLMANFRGEQLSALSSLISQEAADQSRRNAAILPELRPAAGRMETVVLRKLAKAFGLGASHWLDQFAYGFPITGDFLRRRPSHLRNRMIPFFLEYSCSYQPSPSFGNAHANQAGRMPTRYGKRLLNRNRRGG